MDSGDEHRRVMRASGTASFVGVDSDADDAEAASTVPRLDSEQSGQGGAARVTVSLDGVDIVGVRTLTLPRRYSETDGQEQRWGRPAYGDLELERGITPGETQLTDWRLAIEEGRLDEGRKELTVSVQDSARARTQWTFSDAWVREYDPPELDTSADGDIATESATIAFDEMIRTVESSPSRANPLQSGVLGFVETANDGRISNGATVVPAGDIGIESVRLTQFDSTPTIDSDGVTLLVPEAVRSDAGEGETALWFLSGPETGREEPLRIPDDAEGRMYWVAGEEFFHERGWMGGSATDSDESAEGSVPGWRSARSGNRRVLVITDGNAPEEQFGLAGDTDERTIGFEPAVAGEAVPLASTMFVVVGRPTPTDGENGIQVDGTGVDSSDALLDAGRPAPLAGISYSLATLSTPDASVAGQSANPIVRMDTTELLQHDVAREVLRRAGVTDAESVEWLTAPRPTGGSSEAETSTLLGTETSLESFEGVVSGRNGPWLVGIHVARVTDRDHVVAAGVHRHPRGTAGGIQEITGWPSLISQGRGLTKETLERLEYL
jgi:phage tail-like protein